MTLRFVFAAAALAGTARELAAQETTGDIRGRIRDATRRPLGVSVRPLGGDGTVAREGYSAADGIFLWQGHRPGSYTLGPLLWAVWSSSSS